MVYLIPTSFLSLVSSSNVPRGLAVVTNSYQTAQSTGQLSVIWHLDYTLLLYWFPFHLSLLIFFLPTLFSPYRFSFYYHTPRGYFMSSVLSPSTQWPPNGFKNQYSDRILNLSISLGLISLWAADPCNWLLTWDFTDTSDAMHRKMSSLPSTKTYCSSSVPSFGVLN